MRITGPSGQPQISQQTDIYTAQQGETLISIAAKLGVSESVLASTNNLIQGAELKPGQQLNIPLTPQKTAIQQGIASTVDAFENANATPSADLNSKGMIIDYFPVASGPSVQSESDAAGFTVDWFPGTSVPSVQSEGAKTSLDIDGFKPEAKLAEEIRFRSQFQPPQVALGKLKSTSGKTE